MDEVSRTGLVLFYMSRPLQYAASKAHTAKRKATLLTNSSIAKPVKYITTKPSGSALSTDIEYSTFACFNSLPAELRCAIWRHTFPDSRIIEIHDGPRRLERVVGRRRVVPWVSPSRPPVVLQVCRESRDEALRFYQLAFGKNGFFPPRIYVDFQRDVVYFSGLHITSRNEDSPPLQFEEDPILSLTLTEYGEDYGKIERIALYPAGVKELVEWPVELLIHLKEIQVVSLMARGQSFRLGPSPKLMEVEDAMSAGLRNVECSRALQMTARARVMLEEKADAFPGGKVPECRTMEFVKTDGDRYIAPTARSYQNVTTLVSL